MTPETPRTLRSAASRYSLDRRSVLRGLLGGTVVTVGLPPLETMLNVHGTAYADGTEIPRRFGSWFFGNGVVPKFWTPAGAGPTWTATPSLKPFEDAGVKDYVSIVTNTSATYKGFWAHHTTYKTLMAAAVPIYEEPDYKGFPKDFGGPRFDTLIKETIGGKTRFNGLSAKVSRNVSGASYLTGDARSDLFDPKALFDKVFAGGVKPGVGAAKPAAWVLGMRRSVLDLVGEEIAALKPRISAGDRTRLDAHLESIRGLETHLDEANAAALDMGGCDLPTAPAPRGPDEPGRKEPLTEVNRAHADVLTYALSCDLTRTFDFIFHDIQTDTVFWPVGVNEGHHVLGHEEPGDQPKIQKTVVYLMQQLAYFMQKLKDVSVGAGNLLDHTLVFATSEQDSPRDHGSWNVPVLMIGKAGGTLRGGVLYRAVASIDQRFDARALHARALLTALHAMGRPQPSYGVAENKTSSPIPELLT